LIAPLETDNDEIPSQTRAKKRLRCCARSGACRHGDLLHQLDWRRRRSQRRSTGHIGISARIPRGVTRKNPVTVRRGSE
jgi:hypothetical protein